MTNHPKKKAAKRTPPKNKLVIVETPLANSEVAMFAGRLVRRDDKRIVLVDAAFVKDTGRRNQFFAGIFDANCEIEPYPDGVEIELPAAGARVTGWPHPPLRQVR